MEAAWIAFGGSVITSILTLIGVVITVKSNNDKLRMALQEEFHVCQAVTDTKVDELTREVREHNDFARRVPVLEEQIKVANHRIEDLENKAS